MNNILNAVVLSSILIISVMALRIILKNKLTAGVLSLLWAMVLLRLLVPFSIESPVNIGTSLAKMFETNEQAPQDEAQVQADEYTLTETENYSIGETYDTEDFEALYSGNDIAEEPSKFGAFIKNIDYYALAVSLWFTAAFAIVALNGLKLLLFSMRIKGKAADESLKRVLETAREKIGYEGQAALIKSGAADMPAAYGLLRPKIVIPNSMAESMDENQLTLIVMHELMHIKKGDILLNYLWLIAKAIHWFNPLVWIAYRLYITDMEIACDYYAAKNLSHDDKLSYTQSLLDAARIIQKGSKCQNPAVLAFSQERTKLRRRIMNILQPETQNSKQTILIVILILALTLGCFTTACVSHAEQGAEISNEHPGITPTPFPIGVDENGETMYATAYPNDYVTPQVLPDTLTDPWIKTRAIDGFMLTVNMSLSSFSYTMEYFMYTAQMDNAAFDEDFAKNAAQYLLGDTYYSNVDTKDDISAEIAGIESLAGQRVLTAYQQLKVDSAIALLNIAHQSAPEDNAEAAVEFTQSGTQQNLSIKSYDSEGSIERFIIKNEGSEGKYFYYSRGMENEHFVQLKDGIPDTDEAWDEFDKYYDKAKEVVEALTDVNMRAKTTYGAICPEFISMDEASDYEYPGCYAFYFTPIVESKSMLFGIHAIGSDQFQELAGEFDPHLTSYLKVVVDDSGVREILWTDRYEIISTELINQAPLALADAVEIFQEEIFNTDIWYEENVNGGTVYIKGVSYGMVFAVDADGTYKAIPAYGFEGYETLDTYDGTYMEKYSDEGSVYFMLISAIDGSVIDFYD